MPGADSSNPLAAARRASSRRVMLTSVRLLV
jgi:hypothetical protein